MTQMEYKFLEKGNESEKEKCIYGIDYFIGSNVKFNDYQVIIT